MRRADWLQLIGLSLPWGCSFLLFKVLVAELPPAVVAFGRIGLAALALTLLLAAGARRGGEGDRLRLASLRAHWRDVVMLGLLNNALPFTLISWGLTRVPSGTAAICNALSPVFAVLVLRASGGPPLAPHKLAGAAVGVAGVAVLIGPAWSAGGDAAGSLACLGGAMCYALGARFMTRLRGLPVAAVVTAQLWAGAAILLPPVLLLHPPWTLPAPSAGAWAALATLALVSTAFANLLFFRLAASAGAANAMLVTLLIPVTALLAGWAVLGEPITSGAVLGTVVIVAGLALLDGRWLPARLGGPA